MRNSRLLLCSLAALAFANPVWAQGESKIAAAPASVLPDDADVEVVPYVNPGDQIGIACTALSKSNAQSDVRVVLTISAQPGDAAPPAYNKILATDEQVAHGAVRVRIPAMPDLEDQLVNVDVYVVGDRSSQSCNAGHMKIVRQRIAGAPGSVG
jgi:hypothetical protein